MSLKIVTWNMDHWKGQLSIPEHTRAAWSYLDGLAPDIALVQEAVSPISSGEDSQWKACTVPPASEPRSWWISSNRPWGSAVVSYGPDVTAVTAARSPYSPHEVPILQTHPGCVRVAQATLPGRSALTIISVYGLIDAGYAVTTMHRILSDLTPLFDDKRYNERIILGGDLNISTQLPPPHRTRHRIVLDRIKAFGLVDCLDLMLRDARPLANCPCHEALCRHIRTQRRAQNPEVPWQNDYIFASEPLANRLKACYAHDDEGAWQLSDHCPVCAEFDL